ncbi:substrate-binding domain-containing protein [Lysinibacter cavernae]|uniref:Ribose transport system substrate-binding protein n=1 Tax=Lysinibacter cavernae TaxID=1640652 RepID=A0A7X5R3M7_9MICO|nr:substrate-binding domain-containing protein [Lysinibacter cavernae]NIH54782.1 ribose transport system substrate-binding protein [Lysinibacter cavernae]
MFRTQQFIRRGSIIGAASVAALVLASCSSAPDTADGSQTGSSDNPTVAFVAAQMTATYFQVMQCGAQAAADEFNVSLDWQGDPDWDLQTQTPLINAAVQSSPIGLVLVPTDPVGLIETVENISADMPVITVDGSLDEQVELQNIRTDNLSAGALAADALAKAVGEKGTVLVIASFPGVAANAERVDGFAERMAEKYPDIEVLPTEYSDADQATASQKAAAAITNPDLVGIYTTLAPASAGASAAIQAANKTGEVKLVAYDADPSQVADLKAGVYDALVAQDPYGLGYDSVKRIAQINDGSLDPESLEYQEYVNAFIIDRDNADSEEAKRFIYVPTC